MRIARPTGFHAPAHTGDSRAYGSHEKSSRVFDSSAAARARHSIHDLRESRGAANCGGYRRIGVRDVLQIRAAAAGQLRIMSLA